VKEALKKEAIDAEDIKLVTSNVWQGMGFKVGEILKIEKALLGL
jgi:hypothetical protein